MKMKCIINGFHVLINLHVWKKKMTLLKQLQNILNNCFDILQHNVFLYSLIN